MVSIHDLSSAHFRQALQLREQIQDLQQKLEAVLGGKESTTGTKAKKKAGRPAAKRTMSAEGRAKIAAAQKARWAKLRNPAAKVTRAGKQFVKPKKTRGATVKG